MSTQLAFVLVVAIAAITIIITICITNYIKYIEYKESKYTNYWEGKYRTIYDIIAKDLNFTPTEEILDVLIKHYNDKIDKV